MYMQQVCLIYLALTSNRGTPNSGISQLSTVAIKEGERGKHKPYGHAHNLSSTSDTSTNTLDAERADRISRLAGLERVATLRGAHQHVVQSSNPNQQQQTGYFDNTSNIQKSTVGSASATGSIGGSMSDSADKMSEDAEDGISSAGLSDDGNASLVGFGEAASSSRGVAPSNPARTVRRAGSVNNKAHRQRSEQSDSPMEGGEDHVASPSAGLPAVGATPKIRTAGSKSTAGMAQEQAQRIIGETMHEIDGNGLDSPMHGRDLGKFSFEGK